MQLPPDRSWPRTVILVHSKENRAKCSLEPLRARTDLEFIPYNPKRVIALTGYVRLAVGGPELTEADAAMGLLLVDGAWRYAASMLRHYDHLPARSLSGYHTAYPRVSKLFEDPGEGLASVEALYIAYHILGRPTAGLLDHYYWRDEFLSRNGWA